MMTLKEQLRELRENLLRDISYLMPGSEDDRMFSDITLLNYIEDAERRFARQTLCLRDSTTPVVTRVSLRENVVDYKLHPSVLSVLTARIATDQNDLRRFGHSVIHAPYPYDSDEPFDSASVALESPGKPRAFFTDETTTILSSNATTLTVFPRPSSDYEGTLIMLRVIRGPICSYSLDNLDRPSEIPVDYQLDVLEWAAYRAKRNFDADAGSDGGTAASDHKIAFDEAVARAKKELNHTIFAPTRISYGSNGFTW